MKRSLSTGNFNWNLIVDRMNLRFKKEAEVEEAKDSGEPIKKLVEVLDQELVERIKNEMPELHTYLIEWVKSQKQLTYELCREIFKNFNYSLEEEQKKRREDFGQQFNLPADDN